MNTYILMVILRFFSGIIIFCAGKMNKAHNSLHNTKVSLTFLIVWRPTDF
jgi:hypothetical protein